jgi:hypothetical protein
VKTLKLAGAALITLFCIQLAVLVVPTAAQAQDAEGQKEDNLWEEICRISREPAVGTTWVRSSRCASGGTGTR